MGIVKYQDGTTETIADKPLSAGAQGDIYMTADGRGTVKMYFPTGADPRKTGERLQKLIEALNPTKDDPYWEEFFTWPQKLVVQPRLGYRMRFADRVKTMDKFIFPKTFNRLPEQERGWFMGRMAVAVKLASAVQRMSSTGICYPDLSHKNIMVEPFDGRMTLIDCDSVTVPETIEAEVIGTPWYIAPELWTWGARTQQIKPTVRSDRHSLATVLYYWLVGCHPLMGPRIWDTTDPKHDDYLRFGPKAIYIEDEKDPSNHVRTQQIFARALGKDLNDLFTAAFVKGLHDPVHRPQPQQWQQALTRTYDRIIPCLNPNCYWHSFVALRVGGIVCPVCHTRPSGVRAVPFLFLLAPNRAKGTNDYDESLTPEKHHLVGWPGRTLHEWHTRIGKEATYNDRSRAPNRERLAEFEYHANGDVWALRNINLPRMQYRDGNGNWVPVPRGGGIQLTNQMVLQFGDVPEHYRAKVDMINV
jgi:DNA-binding helix-hairpin-helix protein with protein kinase domain